MLRERAAALVSIEPQVPARDVLDGDARLSGSGDSHDDEDVAVALRLRRPGAHRGQALVLPWIEAQRCRAGGRAGGLGPAGARDGDHVRAEAEEPGERDLGLRRVVGSRDARQHLVALEPASTARPAERRVGDHRDSELGAAFDDTSAQSPVVEGADRDLDGRDRRELHGLVQLRAVDVADADARDQAVGDEPCERANRRRPRRARIRRVEQVEVDRQPAECLEARLAVGADRLRATVRDPRAIRSRHAALRHDPHSVRVTERASEQLLVALVGPRGVEHGDPGVEGSGDRLVRLLREPHAAEADA